MADKMRYDLVSPERKLASDEADMISIPGAEGDLTALANHAPFLTTLRPGVVKIHNGGQVTEYVVTGGFAELSPDGASILAEEAVAKADVTADWLADRAKAAADVLEAASGESRAAAALRVNDFKSLGALLGH